MSKLKLETNIPSQDGLIIWSYVFSPDTTSRFADNKYKVSKRYYGEEAEQMKSDLDTLAALAAEEMGVDKLDNNLYVVPKDKDKKPIPGAIEVKFKSKNAPPVVDGKKNRLQASDVPGYKDNCQLGTGMVIYSAKAQPVSGRNYLTLYLQAVQIKNLSGHAVDLDMFDDVEDGFVVDTTDTNDNTNEAVDDIPDFASK